MAHAMKMPFFHGVTDRMDDQGDMPQKSEAAGDGEKTQGDGLHHHEMHELPKDEGGDYHSKHTHPDGRVEHADHASYSEAKDHMDAMHGESKDEDPGRDAEDDFDSDDMAGSYGRAADCE